MQNITWTIGDVRITRLAEVEARFPVEEFLPQASPEALAPHAEWLRPHFLNDDGTVTLSVHALLVESAGQKIIVDTCMGEKPIEGFEILHPASYDFLDRLAAAGFPRESIGTVLCTHLHFDHVGWNTMREGDRWVPTFPNARYLFGRTEWDYCRSGEEAPFTPTLAETVTCVIDAGLADLVETDHKVTDEVRLEATPGHTPGHVSVHIESGGEHALITGDVNHHPVQWAEPTWEIFAEDVNPAVSADTRRRLVREHADSGTLVIGTHYPTPTAGHLRTRNGGCRFEV